MHEPLTSAEAAVSPHHLAVAEPAHAAGIQTQLLAGDQHGAWDKFVAAHPHGTPFHLMAWSRAIEKTFGYRPMHLVSTSEGRVRAVLPLFLVRNILVRQALISTPFAVYGGVLADSAEAAESMRAYVTDLAHSLGVQYVELRNAHPEQCLGFEPLSRYVTFTQPIAADEEGLLTAIPRKTRRMVRKSFENGFTTQSTKDISRFEALYAANLQRLGTPCFPRRHFTNLIENFGEMLDIREILMDGKVVAGVMSFRFRERLLPYYGASDPAYNAYAPNNFMYFDLMRWGAKNGFLVFDFGRSKKQGSGSYDFKAHWGMEERELPYEILLVRRKQMPNYSPNNAAFSAPMAIWRRIPLPVARLVGPLLVKLVP